MADYGYTNLSPRAKKLLSLSAGTVLLPKGQLLDGNALMMHLRAYGVTRKSRCGRVREGTTMHIKHAEKIAVTCSVCFR